MKIQYKHIVALIYAITLFLDRLDLTLVNIALPTVAKKFNVPITSTDWVNMSFLLALAISMPISGWLADRFGSKKIYVLAMILFGVGSTLCAWAPNLDALILLRFIHGLGGGMLIPVGMTMIYRIYAKSEYASITSFTFIPSLIAPAIAPFLGGILLDVWGWQIVFLFSGPICLILAIIAIIVLHEDTTKTVRAIDWPGFIFFSALLINVFYTLSLIGKRDHLFQIFSDIILLILLIYAFIKSERKTKFPLIDLKYFKNVAFLKANFIQLCFQICHFGAIFLVGMYLQVGLGMSASRAGLIMGMQAFGAIAISRYSVKLFNRNGARTPLVIGFLGIAILSPCIMLIQYISSIIFALVLFFLRGIFSGLCGTPIQTLGVIGFDKHRLSTANTIFNVFRQISISFGVAISSSLMALGMRFVKFDGSVFFSRQHIFAVFGPSFLIISIVALIGVNIVKDLKSSDVSIRE